MRTFLLNLAWSIHLLTVICKGSHVVDLPAFDGKNEVNLPPPEGKLQKPTRRNLDDPSDSDEVNYGRQRYKNDSMVDDIIDNKSKNPSNSDIKVEQKSASHFNKSVDEYSSCESETDYEEKPSHYPPLKNLPFEEDNPFTDVIQSEERNESVLLVPNARRHWMVSEPTPVESNSDASHNNGKEDKDSGIKNKITMLVQQTMQDTEAKVKSIQYIKEKHRDQAPYRIGFILSMVKKSRDVLNELFNVAVKHREEWKALEQLKIFELIVHTNVDTTNLVRQLVELHINNLNAMRLDKIRLRASGDKDYAKWKIQPKNRVVIL